MTFQQEAASWAFPASLSVSSPPDIGSKAPSTDQLVLPLSDAKPAVVTFLRHCGCPFAEKTFIAMRSAAAANPSITFIAVSHSDQASTDNWLTSLDGPGAIDIIVDDKRSLYAKWGLGASSFAHVLSPWSMWSVVKLGREEGIWNKPTESGSRWQTGGTWALDAQGTVKWGGPATRADDLPNVDQAVQAVSEKS